MEQTFELKREHLQDYRHYVHWVLGKWNLVGQIIANVIVAVSLYFFALRYEGNARTLILGLSFLAVAVSFYVAYAWRFVRAAPSVKAKLALDDVGITYQVGTDKEDHTWVAIQRLEQHRGVHMLRLPDQGRVKHAILVPKQEKEWVEFVQARIAGSPVRSASHSPELSGEEE